jgi:hypothetical protein
VGQQENDDRAYSNTGFLNKRGQRMIEKEGAWKSESILHGGRGGPAGEWRQSLLHHWLEQDRTIEKEGAWRLREGRVSYMVAEVGQQENGDRASSTTGLNKTEL